MHARIRIRRSRPISRSINIFGTCVSLAHGTWFRPLILRRVPPAAQASRTSDGKLAFLAAAVAAPRQTFTLGRFPSCPVRPCARFRLTAAVALARRFRSFPGFPRPWNCGTSLPGRSARRTGCSATAAAHVPAAAALPCCGRHASPDASGCHMRLFRRSVPPLDPGQLRRAAPRSGSPSRRTSTGRPGGSRAARSRRPPCPGPRRHGRCARKGPRPALPAGRPRAPST